ncbi:hypothetical protein PY257_10845, partial [Ramlibacter sp. H39-3-26]|uniref:hypothetical protein n=1 Tax=Curvibacter soli TaxID=3031331 RepID=UPI0023DB0018
LNLLAGRGGKSGILAKRCRTCGAAEFAAARRFRGRTVSAVFNAKQHIKPRLLTHGGVANPRDSDGYRCGAVVCALPCAKTHRFNLCRQASSTALAKMGPACEADDQ